MAKINLLPWRLERRKQRQNEFYMLLGGAAALALLLAFGMVKYFDAEIAGQNDRNTYLQQQITALDKQIKEIEELERTEARLLARKDVIEQLQAKLNDARARQKTIVMRTNATQSRLNVNRQLHNYSIDNAMNKFEYYEKKIDLMEGQVDSLYMEQKGLQSEFDELASQEKINQELQAIKTRLNK
mgnify:CR=1 FL=1